MRHLDLFSGIGGFALAADRVWGNVEHIFCDNDEFCQEVLKKHWPDSRIYSDIREFTADSTSQRCGTGGGDREERHLLPNQDGVSEKAEQERNGWERRTTETAGVDLLTGGFPCQPFSQAGRRRGTADDRYLWPEMFRVIKEFQPTWVIAENVRGLLTWSEGLVLEQVCTDLESEGYEVQPIIIPAVAVNAPHRRDRLWIVAHKSKPGLQQSRETRGETSTRGTRRGGFTNNNSNAPDTRRTPKGSQEEPERSSSNAPGWGWSRNWVEVATELCRVDDGLPKRLDRNSRLKALGNAIVPQVAEEIMKAIKLVEEERGKNA